METQADIEFTQFAVILIACLTTCIMAYQAIKKMISRERLKRYISNTPLLSLDITMVIILSEDYRVLSTKKCARLVAEKILQANLAPLQISEILQKIGITTYDDALNLQIQKYLERERVIQPQKVEYRFYYIPSLN